MSQHAKLSASAAHRWMACPGSVRLSEGLPDSSSEAAAAGTVAHDLAARCLLDPQGGAFLNDEVGRVITQDGYKITIDAEMVDAVRLYLDALAASKQPDDVDWVEVDLTPHLKTIDPSLGGTADHVRFRPATRHLFVTDFKYGAGVLVNPEGNKQLRMYALGALLDAESRGAFVKTIAVRVVQPRIEHEDSCVREETFHAAELLSFVADVQRAAEATRDPDAPLVAGEAQCKWCPAKHICPELEKRQHALTAVEFTEIKPYDPATLAHALASFPLVEARIKAVREFAYAEAERGNPPPGWKLVSKRGVRRWVDEESVRTWAEAKAVDPFEEPKMKSPAQLEKELNKDQKKELGEMTVTVSSGHTLVPETDKRPAVHLALASEFALIPGNAE